jgi:type II secretion system protein N
MQIFKTRISWAIYIICAALFFLYYLFPSDAVKEYLADRLNQANPNLTVAIGALKPAFPAGIKLHDVIVYHRGTAAADFENLKISPKILSLFFDKTHLAFNGNAYGGKLTGQVDIIKNSPVGQVMIDADLEGIQVNRLEALNTVSTHRISGILDGTLAYRAKVPNQTLRGNLTLSDGQIEFSAPVLNQNVFTFNTIDAELELNGRVLTIKSCQIEGNQLDADIAGSIKLTGRSAKKMLNLFGTVKPHPALLAKLGKNIATLVTSTKAGDRGFSFKITGSVDSPRYAFK